uniref:Uncharacterized protein n=1 Tax=Peronospora matthiolae TaxID=2874970 RepID=A0AAV1UH44_9STRA
MTELKSSSNTLKEFLKEGAVGYESDIAASSFYGPPPDTPTARDTTRVAPNPFLEREEVPSPLAQRAVVEPTLGVLHNILDEDQALSL